MAETGLHTLNVWMREDGFALDKLVLTTDGAYAPLGQGPSPSVTVVPPPAGSGGSSNSVSVFFDRCAGTVVAAPSSWSPLLLWVGPLLLALSLVPRKRG